MKKHAPEGARILKEILKDVDDADFKRIAVNVAHYHHERWDGKGYPDGLKGEEIPLEARIMAVADVYDALVSKRVYKDKMSFKDSLTRAFAVSISAPAPGSRNTTAVPTAEKTEENSNGCLPLFSHLYSTRHRQQQEKYTDFAYARQRNHLAAIVLPPRTFCQ